MPVRSNFPILINAISSFSRVELTLSEFIFNISYTHSYHIHVVAKSWIEKELNMKKKLIGSNRKDKLHTRLNVCSVFRPVLSI